MDSHNRKASQDPSFGQAWIRDSRRSFFAQQREAAWGESHRAFAAETRRLFRSAFARRASSPVVETFASLVARKRISQAELDQQLSRSLLVHWLLYALAGLLLVYGTWQIVNIGLVGGLAVYAAAAGAVVHGYVAGYRAWQIQRRTLISLRQAVLTPSTWLVL